MKRERIILGFGKQWEKGISEKYLFKDIPKRAEGRRSGVYILYNKKRIIYIGKSVKNKKSLRGRICEHISDHLKNKWDSFSWFIVRKRYTSELEALMHNIFWKVQDVTLNELKAQLRGKRYIQKEEIKKIKQR